MKHYSPLPSLLVCLMAGTCLAAAPEPMTLKAHEGGVRALAFSPDGKLLASGGAVPSEEPSEKGYARGEVILWDVATGERQRVLVGHPGEVNCLAFSPDGEILASGGQRQYRLVNPDTSQNLKVWDVVTGKEIVTLLGQTHGVTCVAFSADGNTLASGSGDGTVKLRLRDQQWKTRATLKPPTRKTAEEGVVTLGFHPHEGWLATGCTGGVIEVWDTTTLRLRRKLRVHQADDNGCFVEISPSGKTLATSTPEGVVQFWDTESFRVRGSFEASTKGLWHMALSPDGKLLAAAGGPWDQPGSVILWHPPNHKRAAVLKGHTMAVSGLATSSDGKLLASASFDGTVKVWQLNEVMDQ